ncbi:Rpn family recombination-promoting nuclease/putative transposase [Rhodoferax sp. 4810]|uniref:Rpn family recombination-promoting nuclease/putative transposase n=1 Tax=Thiospirillum jenense TaxID=1653858 RepID=A0A839HHG6_9GAMM|nr:Rpn family recombination-promoting nuclease/putative transposase [Thiospirillum jenense]MBB1074317.1 Rpn family recombination-promoting nuclease/putative transposase [Rhodoferax jenense]MBB1126478.1 Rpn family recombination-promoting nuclease/putative transposase [Thiospirillum jenense]
MRRPIDPKVDCVFKALLGSNNNRNLLVHFLNATLGETLRCPIREVEILNPYNDREQADSKLSIVDIKAQDENKQQYQIEIQLLNHSGLSARIIYNWGLLYTRQLKESDPYELLKPSYSIWLLAEPLLDDQLAYFGDPEFLHVYRFRDNQGRCFHNHGGIWLLELSKFQAADVETELQRWLRFFLEAERLDSSNLPVWMQTNEMRQAMQTLKLFSDEDRAYWEYQDRISYLRIQRSLENDLKQALQEKEAVLQEREIAIQEKEAAVQEKDIAIQEKDAAVLEAARLKALLDQLHQQIKPLSE